MSGDKELSDEKAEDAYAPLGESAFVVVDKANCLYKPDLKSAVRVIPPYGTEVDIVNDEGSWVLIRYSGKEAWSPRGNLSANLVPQRPAVNAGVVPQPDYYIQSSGRLEHLRQPQIEFGPRGGRFVRTDSGFKRYL